MCFSLMYWPSKASLSGSRNRSNSISSMAARTSPAFSVFRLAFMAKLFALWQGKPIITIFILKEWCNQTLDTLHNQTLDTFTVLRSSQAECCESKLNRWMSHNGCDTHQDVAYNTNTLAAWDMALLASFDTFTPSGSWKERKSCGGFYFQSCSTEAVWPKAVQWSLGTPALTVQLIPEVGKEYQKHISIIILWIQSYNIKIILCV